MPLKNRDASSQLMIAGRYSYGPTPGSEPIDRQRAQRILEEALPRPVTDAADYDLELRLSDLHRTSPPDLFGLFELRQHAVMRQGRAPAVPGCSGAAGLEKETAFLGLLDRADQPGNPPGDSRVDGGACPAPPAGAALPHGMLCPYCCSFRAPFPAHPRHTPASIPRRGLVPDRLGSSAIVRGGFIVACRSPLLQFRDHPRHPILAYVRVNLRGR